MATITVMDPVTRIEGHLKVQVTVDLVNGKNQVVDAKCTGTLFRGFETILNGRDPKDAPILTQRICGVCPVSHSLASTLALEAAKGMQANDNGRILRNLTLGANFLQSHILHFYLLAALDYVKGPQSAPWTPGWNVDMRVDPRLDTVASHLTNAIEARRRAHEMGAVFGGRMPSPHTLVPGGYTNVPTAAKITAFKTQLTWLTNFINTIYLPDVTSVATVYSDYKTIGKGYGNLLAYGVFDQNAAGSTKLLKRGLVNASAPTAVAAVNTASITESVTYSWYNNSTNGMKPAGGSTLPVDPNTKTAAYSWLKAPRYNNVPYETGALARMWVNGDYRTGVSVIDRHAARAKEALKVAQAMSTWLTQLSAGSAAYTAYTNPTSGSGVGLTEAPRGALGHWVSISNSKVSNYQIITPTCWNASPMDSSGQKGPMEKAIIGTPVADPTKPVEVLRVIHSFDPCLSCAVHVMRPNGKPVVIKTGGCA